MSLLSRILGHDGTKLPYDVLIGYANGTEGNLHLFAEDMRDCLAKVCVWMPLQVPAKSLVITEREP